MKKSTRVVANAAMIAALYVILTEISTLMGLSSGVIQIRFSEALTVLPYFTPAAVPGLFIGCIISNLLAGGMLLDIVFGSIATLIGAYCTYLFRKKSMYFAPVFPILSNTLMIPWILKLVYGFEGTVLYFSATVFAGEFISCGIFGISLMLLLKKRKELLRFVIGENSTYNR